MSTPRVTAAFADVLTFADPTDAAPAEGRETPRERALIDAARAGNQDAFGDLVTLHQRAVFRTALAALGRREDAEDVTQEAFVVAWTKLPGFRREATFKTWLLTITWRKALDRRRVRQRWWSRTVAPLETDLTDPLDDVADRGADPEQQTVDRDAMRRMHAAIALLSPKLRDTLVLAASGEHSYSEIAGILGIPVGTVKWRVVEARRLLGSQREY